MIKKLLSFAAVAAMTMTASADTLPLSLEDLGSGWDSSYDAATKTITFDDAWKGRGWWFTDIDFSAYDEVVVEYEASEFDVKLVVEYVNEGVASTDAVSPAGKTSVTCPLAAEGKEHVKQIFIQNSAAGTLTLTDAYLQNEKVVDPTATKELWSGEQALDWWDHAIKLPVSDFIAAKIKAGDDLNISFINNGNEAEQKYCNLKVQLLLADWSQAILPGFAASEGFQEEYGTVNIPFAETSGVFTIKLGEADVKELTDSKANQSLMLVGENITVTKVELVPADGPSVSINNVAVDANAPAEYYNLQGVRVANPSNGIYVVRQGNKVSKVLVK